MSFKVTVILYHLKASLNREIKAGNNTVKCDHLTRFRAFILEKNTAYFFLKPNLNKDSNKNFLKHKYKTQHNQNSEQMLIYDVYDFTFE